MTWLGRKQPPWTKGAMVFFGLAILVGYKLAKQAYLGTTLEATQLEHATGVFTNVVTAALIMLGFVLVFWKRLDVRKKLDKVF